MQFNCRRVGRFPDDVGTSDVLKLVTLQVVFEEPIQLVANHDECELPTLERWLEDTVHTLRGLMW